MAGGQTDVVLGGHIDTDDDNNNNNTTAYSPTSINENSSQALTTAAARLTAGDGGQPVAATSAMAAAGAFTASGENLTTEFGARYDDATITGGFAAGYSWLASASGTDWRTPAGPSSSSSPPSSSSSSLSSLLSYSLDARTTERYHVEDEFTGLHNILGRNDDKDDDLDDSRDLVPLLLIAIITLAIVGNLIVCVVVRIDRRLHQMTYYFFVSMATLHVVMATIVMPPAIMIIITGK